MKGKKKLRNRSERLQRHAKNRSYLHLTLCMGEAFLINLFNHKLCSFVTH